MARFVAKLMKTPGIGIGSERSACFTCSAISCAIGPRMLFLAQPLIFSFKKSGVAFQTILNSCSGEGTLMELPPAEPGDLSSSVPELRRTEVMTRFPSSGLAQLSGGVVLS